MNWKKVKDELPKEACHTETLWCSQQVLVREPYETPNHEMRYSYDIAWYHFNIKCFLSKEMEKVLHPTEWCELEIFVKDND